MQSVTHNTYTMHADYYYSNCNCMWYVCTRNHHLLFHTINSNDLQHVPISGNSIALTYTYYAE